MKHSTVIPLIGGVAIASENVFGTPPDKIYSYKAFAANDSHLLNYYQQRDLDIPYIDVEEMPWKEELRRQADVISTVCPCAGLSTLSHSAAPDNPKNDWMIITAEFVLGQLEPKVFWGENAPTFAGQRGEQVRKRLYEIANKYGYTMLIYKTKSLDHGLPQYRARSFYFFFKETDSVPVFEYFHRKYTPIEEFLDSVKGNTQRELTNETVPTDNIYYRYVLDVMYPGMTHIEFLAQLDKSYELIGYIRNQGVTFYDLAKYFRSIDREREAAKCERRAAKIESGGGIMSRSIYVPKNRIGAFVGYLPRNMTHHRENRFLSYRECMSIMGLPEDFELLDPKKNLNHVCQNVPVTTATDMASQIKKYLDGQLPMKHAKVMFQSNERQKDEIWEKEQTALTFA